MGCPKPPPRSGGLINFLTKMQGRATTKKTTEELLELLRGE